MPTNDHDPLSGAEIPFSYTERTLTIILFRSTQCFQCKKFYTTPFLCPFKYPQSNCGVVSPLSDGERDKFLLDPKWTSIMEDQMRHLQRDAVIARCRKCKELNINPIHQYCWNCGESLTCPSCHGGAALTYDIGKNILKCDNNYCNDIFQYCSKHNLYYSTKNKEGCPKCSEEQTASIFDVLKRIIPDSTKPTGKENRTAKPDAIQKPSHETAPQINQQSGAPSLNPNGKIAEQKQPSSLDKNSTNNEPNIDKKSEMSDEELRRFYEINSELIKKQEKWRIRQPEEPAIQQSEISFKNSGKTSEDPIQSSSLNNPSESSNPLDSGFPTSRSKPIPNRGDNEKPPLPKQPMPRWLLPSLLMFGLACIGFGISLYVGSFIPFWMLLTFCSVFSVQKWFLYSTRRYTWVGRGYKLLLNLVILWFFGIIVWSGFKLFSQQFLFNPLAGALVFLSELGLFIWLNRILSKNKTRWPSMKLTIFALIALFLIFAFAGVQPMASYKDAVLNPVISFFKNTSRAIQEIPSSTQSQLTLLTPPTKPSGIAPVIITPVLLPTQTATSNQGIDRTTGQYKNYYLGLVKEPEGTESNSYGNFVVLINNNDAKNPTYSQLVNFLKSDKTDQYPYTYVISLAGSYYGSAESHVDLVYVQSIIDGTKQPNPPRICADFAEMLHNNAENAQIRCAYITIDLSGYTDPYNYGIPSNSGHALVAFETTDRGLIYIDDTGGSGNNGPSNCDKVVDVQIGKSYVPQSLFPEPGWSSTWDSMGTVTNIFLTWDGKWNN